MRHFYRLGLFSTVCISALFTAMSTAAPLGAQVNITKAQMAAASIQTARLTPETAAENGAVTLKGSVVAAPGAQVAFSLPEDVTVTNLIRGNLLEVKAGQAVLRVSSPMFVVAQKDLLDSASAHALALRDFQRDQALFKEGLIPKVRLDRTQQVNQVAAAGAQAARQRLKLLGVAPEQIAAIAAGRMAADWIVTAPRTGQIVGLNTVVGDHVGAGSVLFSVLDPSSIELRLYTDPATASRIRPGARLTVDGCKQTATVLGTGSSIEPNSQSVLVRAAVTAKSESPCLRINQLVSALVQLDKAASVESAGQVINSGRYSVPAPAVVFQDGKQWIFIQNATGFRALAVRKVADAGDKVLIEPAEPADLASKDAKVAVTGLALIKAAWQGMGGQE